MENSRRSALTIILNTFFICIVAYFIEYKFFYAKIIPVFGTAIISRIFGIIAIFVALRMLKSNFKSIGFIAKPRKIISGVVTPLIVLGVCTIASFLFIKLLIESQGGVLVISFKTAVSSLEAQDTASQSYISFYIAIISALISSFMIETLLRGLVLQTANTYLRFYAANTLTVVLSIIWHNVVYVFGLTSGSTTTTAFVRSFICSTVIYAAAAIRRSLYIRSSGAIWSCIVDYFVSMIVIGNIMFTVDLPYDFVPTNPIEYLVSFMSSKLNNTYATIAFMGMVSVLSLIVMVIYCKILKKRARKKFIKKISENNDTELN